jgi:hypothetical protein
MSQIMCGIKFGLSSVEMSVEVRYVDLQSS